MKKTIVIAEDNRVVRLAVCYYLNRRGFHVRSFENGYDAYLFIKNNRCDLLITDIEMPVMDGISLVKKIQTTIDKKVPIIVMSSCLKHIGVARSLFGADSLYFNKPLAYDKLMEGIGVMLSGTYA